MQVDPTSMNVGDGSPVIKEAGAPNKASVSMVGNPPQTLPPELRGDGPLSQQTTTATATDCKASEFSSEDSSLNPRPEAPPCPQHEGALLLGPASVNIASLRKNIEVPKPAVDGSPVFPTQQWTCSKKPPLNSSHGGVTPSKRTNSQAQSVISLPAGFQCSSLFKPGQPVAFLPSATFSPPLCKITLPPGLGQIAALRETSSSQLHVECQPQTSSSGVTPNLQTYPYHFSMAKAPAPEAQLASTTAQKNKHRPVSGRKNSNAGAEHSSPLHSVTSPIVARPLKLPTSGPASPLPVSLSPSSPPAMVSTHSRLLNHLEKSPSHQGVDKTPIMYSRIKSHTVTEVRDVPLDLSSKSKRPKLAKDPQDSSPAAECHLTEDGQGCDSVPPKRAVPATFGTGGHLSIFPEALRNGAPPKQASQLVNHQAHKLSMPWVKSPNSSTSNLAGTYVGVASPILASTLRSKDGKGAAFVEDLQSTAKQVTISIIDQGEQQVPRVMKGPSVVKNIQHTLGSNYSDSACLPKTQVGKPSTPKDGIAAVLSISTGLNPHCKPSGGRTMVPLSPAVDNAAHHQPVPLPHQGSTVKQKIIQVTPKLRVTTGCKGPLFQSDHLSPSKVVEKKLGKTKSPLSNLESIVKQKALETSALVGEGCCTAASAGPRKPEAASLNFGPQDTPSSGFSPFRPMKRREGKAKKDSSKGLSAKISGKQENGNIAGPREISPEKQIGREEDIGNEECSNNSKLPQAQILDCSGHADKNGVKTKSQMDEEKPVSESLSPCVKLEGMALSILKGQSPDVDDLGNELNVTRGVCPSKGEVTVSKNKKINQNKVDKSSLMSSKKMARCLKRSREKEGNSSEWPHHRKKKQGAPVVGSGQLDIATSQLPKEWDKAGGGWSNLNELTRPPHIKAGNEGSSEVDAPALQGSPGWLKKEAGPVASSPPRQKRGRRPAGKNLPATKVPPPAPQPQVRRKRGRPRSNPLPDQVCLGAAKPAPAVTERDASPRKKRKRRRNRKYQNGEYVMERDKAGEEDGKCVATRQATRAGTDQRVGLYPRLSATLTCRSASPDRTPRRPLQTRSGSARHFERPASPEPEDKPSGKRKFKSKHLCDTEEKKFKAKRGSPGKRPAAPVSDGDGSPVKKPPDLPASPRGRPSLSPGRRGSAGRGRTPEPPSGRPVPPEVRRLIVNKNAGETLLQRAARLGYQEVVLYCLEKDEREVNRRDNAGYTALHEACARGWTQIVQVLLEHGADVNCSAQDGTRPIHDAVASDNLPAVWMLLNRGADPTLATYSGQTAVKLAQSNNMKTFLSEYFADLDGRSGQDTSTHWDFYSSAVFEAGQEACWDFLLSLPEMEEGRNEASAEEDCFMFEFSSEPLLPCYHVQVSLSQGYCNWFLLSDVLKRLKMSARIFRARYPHLEVVSISWAELCRQVSVSQVTSALEDSRGSEDEEAGGQVELVRCVLELQELLGSSVHFLEAESSDAPAPLGCQSPPATQTCPKADPVSQSSKSKKLNKKEER